MHNTLTRNDLVDQNLTEATETVLRLWDVDMDIQTRQSIDKIVEYMTQTGVRPNIIAQGDIVKIITTISQDLVTIIPAHLSYQLNHMIDYIAQWLCDYAEMTKTTSLKIKLAYDAKLNDLEDM